MIPGVEGRLSLVTGPTEEPISLEEAKAHLRVDGNDEDTLIQSLIVAAREHVETITRRALLTQTWDLFFDYWPGPGWRWVPPHPYETLVYRPAVPGWGSTLVVLPLPPLQSVTEVCYTPAGGEEQTLASTEYVVDTVSEPGRIVVTGDLPGDELAPVNGVRIRFVAGWPAAEAVPQTIRQAMHLLVGDFYENREESILIQGLDMQKLPFGVQALLANHRVW